MLRRLFRQLHCQYDSSNKALLVTVLYYHANVSINNLAPATLTGTASAGVYCFVVAEVSGITTIFFCCSGSCRLKL